MTHPNPAAQFSTNTFGGTVINDGLSERGARKLAQRQANERGEQVDVYRGRTKVDSYFPQVAGPD